MSQSSVQTRMGGSQERWREEVSALSDKTEMSSSIVLTSPLYAFSYSSQLGTTFLYASQRNDSQFNITKGKS